MKDQTAIKEATKLLDEYCEGCFLKAHYRHVYGRKRAHQFCIHRCSIGKELKALGSMLGGEREDE
ncbi:zinc-finger domain-containing protein [Bacillaceae bacterium SIJ1]|uniref:zinc-finger domain-containing protein n=1 Tax=Litoribacterium kuwaitense TaxID=1398745 RepID=UPI0013ED01C7|nr:zinc-finger domain-containing protein [Litoribacterium kuwaitense]NGP43768.1 zinc-finger domain-containing protein [Litoribacterium kuwaitense]